MLCMYRLKGKDSCPVGATTNEPSQKVGPLWKLMHVVEPRPIASESLALRDEKSERFVLDGPFTETKS